MAQDKVRPGEEVPSSGQYVAEGPRGGRSDNEATLVEGKTAPPTPKKNQTWVNIDPSKHKSGKRK